MRSLDMQGPLPLSHATIDEKLMRTSPGNYALGYMDGDFFTVFYVGRSDRDLRGRLHEWVGMPHRYESYASVAKASWGLSHRGALPVGTPESARVESCDGSYTHFAYSYAGSANDAYAKEWRNYDAFGGGAGLDNRKEPMSMPDSTSHLA
jgi:hypothetical protein